MASDAQTRINLTALKRRDPYIANILDSATHVAVYTFNPNSGEWEKTDIEGTLFVYSRLAPPMAGFTIMNQLNMENLTEPLTNSHEFQNQRPFLLYRNAKMEIFGIWFYDMYDCSRIGDLLVTICKDKDLLNKPPIINNPLQPSSPTSSSSSSAISMLDGNMEEEVTLTSANIDNSALNSIATNSSVDIMQILSNAKKDYDKGHTKPEEGIRVRNKISKADLFKQVTTDADSKKVKVATLFQQTHSKKDVNPNRPLSANTLNWSKPEKKITAKQPPAEPHHRYGSRSLSLSLTNEQLQNNLPNGAISVEELESPVLGMPAQRTRYHSVNESSLQTPNASRLPTSESNAPFHKLLSKVDNFSIKDSVESARPINPYVSTKTGSTLQSSSSATSFTSFDGAHLKNNLQRPLSIPGGGGGVKIDKGTIQQITSQSTNPTFTHLSTNSSFDSLISAFPPNTMPTLHEHVSPRTNLMKSISLSSGMSQISSSTPFKNPALQVVATLHGSSSKEKEQAKLLPPHALHLTKTSTPSTISALAAGSTFPTSSSTSTPILDNHPSSVEAKTLIAPGDFEHSSTTPQKAMQLRKRLLPTAQKPDSIEPLDKTQLAGTLIALLQTDPAFVDTIHKAYLSGVNTRNSDKPADNETTFYPLKIGQWK